MSRLCGNSCKDTLDHPGSTLQELKVLRQEGRLPDGERIPAPLITRWASQSIGENVGGMDQDGLRGVNDTLGNEESIDTKVSGSRGRVKQPSIPSHASRSN